MSEREQTQVMVSGAGPVGSVMALALARQGFNVVLCEKHGERAQDLRASTFHPPTLEILDDLGVIEPLLEYGLKAPIYHFRERKSGEVVPFDFGELEDATRFPFRLQCEQHVMANVVEDALRKMPNVQMLYNHSVVCFDRKDDGVDVDVEAPHAMRHFSCDYLIAADGGNSIVRKWLDVKFEGFTYPEKFVCLSTEIDLSEHLPNLANVNYVADEEEWLVLLRAPSAWRVLVPVSDELENATLLDDPFKERVFRDLIGIPEVETKHRTVYRVHQRVAESFNFGRVFLIGDAAHLNNPLGGFGMNSGIHDAWNLSQKVIESYASGHDDELFKLFDKQRRSVTHDFIQAQTIENKRFLEHNPSQKHDMKLREMKKTASDDTLRREFLLRQSMIQSVASEQAFV
ncbi:MAG: FAD-dependent oxidoreductase [Congregibacter sp.]